MRQENFARTGHRDNATDAEIVEISVKVKEKDCSGERRLFTTRDQVLQLLDDALLKRVNYAEDLLARAAITRANTDATGKKAQREQSLAHWKANDKTSFGEFVMADGFTQAKLDAALEKYYADNLAE